MNKKLLSVITLLGWVGIASAQTILTAANSNPVAGDKYITYYSSTNSGTLTSGAGLTWDFPTISVVSSDTFRFVPCDAASSCSSFPGSNIVARQNNYIGSYDNASTDSLVQTAEGTHLWDDPKMMFRYPFTYNDKITDSFKYFSLANLELSRGADTMLADGYGTLGLLGVTYPGVLRVHHTETRYDSVWAFVGTPTFTRIDAYEWYAPGFHMPKVVVAFVNRNGVQDTLVAISVLYLATAVTNVNQSAQSLTVYPNPTQGELNIVFTATGQEQQTITLTDMAGRQVAVVATGTFNKGENKIVYATSSLPKGIYLLRLVSGNEAITKRVVVQ